MTQRAELLAQLRIELDHLSDETLEGILSMLQHRNAKQCLLDTAPQHVQASLEEGIDQAERGETISHEAVSSQITAKFKPKAI